MLKLDRYCKEVTCWVSNGKNSGIQDKSYVNYREMYLHLIIFFAAKDGEALYSQQKQDLELTVAQIMNSLLPNSDLNWRE